MLLSSEDPAIARVTQLWALEELIKGRRLSGDIRESVLQQLCVFKASWLRMPLLEWLPVAGLKDRGVILEWLSELDYASPAERVQVIEPLLTFFIQSRLSPKMLLESLKALDVAAGEVTDVALQRFPLKNVEENCRIIDLLGKTARYRVIKPLICYAEEYPQYLRTIMKALSKFEYDEVNQFYIQCLKNHAQATPIVLIEAIKQVRKRRLRKAIPFMDALFPMEESQTSLVNRAINGEIAVTMASFGAYAWAREKLLPEMMLGGIHLKYLKAIDMLHLEEAVPLIKAIMLMPETPELQVIQLQAYQICERLLSEGKSTSSAGFAPAQQKSDLQGFYSTGDFLAF